jgi:hypothetical protein
MPKSISVVLGVSEMMRAGRAPDAGAMLPTLQPPADSSASADSSNAPNITADLLVPLLFIGFDPF